ncbi:MAG: ECF-type sigma factor, partial [Lysobacterales bacterium]
MDERGRITRLFEGAAGGDEAAFERVVAMVYDELEQMAGRQLRRRFDGLDGITLEPAALVNETLLRLLPDPPCFANRRHFFALASKAMRCALIDYQRARGRVKRGGQALRVTLTGLGAEAAAPPETDAAQVCEVLERLERLDPRKCEVVQLRIFWGMEMAEIAGILGVSLATVERDWSFSRAWLA